MEPFTVWFTGLSGSGKSTLAQLVGRRLRDSGMRVELLDGDELRTRLCRGLGYTKEDRDENVRRIGFVCELLARHGVSTVVAAISPYRAARDAVRAGVPNFVEVHMDCPLDVLLQRDVKGLYKKALAGEIPRFTGISDPYEPPLRPEVRIDSSQEPCAESARRVWAALEELGLLPAGILERSPA